MFRSVKLLVLNAYIVYQITNLLNSKIYIGVNKISDPNIDDGYMGSSKYLANAIRKNGAHNFKKEEFPVSHVWR